MMSEDIAVKVENLSKIYKLYNTPVDRLKESLHPMRRQYHHDFYALNDVSFEIKKGESVGIIGKNGSGKSTLLKILTGVLTPTNGTVQVNGKISALLELGAGFNPELNGVDNVYFNGMLMGYTRKEMDDRLDAILSFADIGEFLQQPVKTYSSGMFVRLAFAVAVNVEPEILIIDEALAVGDLRFQKKCKEKMNEFKQKGCTIIIVSHSMADINTMCQYALYLNNGVQNFFGASSDAINQYTYEDNKTDAILSKTEELRNDYSGDKGSTGDIAICNVACYQKDNDLKINEIEFRRDLVIEFDYEALHEIQKPIFRINFSVQGYKYFANIDSVNSDLMISSLHGKGRIRFNVTKPNLYPNSYKINIGVLTEELNSHLFFWNEAANFIVKAPRGKCMANPFAIIEFDATAQLLTNSYGNGTNSV